MQKDVLKENGLKNTESRKFIIQVLEEAQEPLTAEEIFLQTRKLKDLNFSTVYRTLSKLAEKSIIIKSVGGEGKSYFQLNNHNHSHYLVCMDCRKRIPIDGCPLEKMGADLGEKTGFHITGHNLEFVGECPECYNKKNIK